jgi:non-heme chloroperoxidase
MRELAPVFVYKQFLSAGINGLCYIVRKLSSYFSKLRRKIMSQSNQSSAQLAADAAVGATQAIAPVQPPEEPTIKLQKVVVNGAELHYLEQGQGDPLVLIHGGLADYREWDLQMERFAQSHRVIAYSRRYNYPNQNREIQADHSALVEAEDLAAFLGALDLDQSDIVGYSYGAFTALILALDHPQLVHALVLVEPPVLRWAVDLPGGDAVFAEFMSSFWEPVGVAFRQEDKEQALRLSVNFFAGADILDELPAEVRQAFEDNLHDWEALTTSSDAFPMIAKEQVQQMQIPTLLLTAGKTMSIHQLVNDELECLLPQGTRVTIPDATHEMWTQQPEACGAAVLKFLEEQA